MLSVGGISLGMQDTLRALADPTRREILNLLKKSRLSAGEIGDHFSISGAAVSRHLSVLKEADLIRDEREGKFIYYELNTTVLEEIMLWITELKGGNDHRLRRCSRSLSDCFCGSSFRIPLQPIGAQATNRTATHPRLLQCSGFR